MESKFQTSFIPKTTIEDGGKLKMSSPYSIFLVIASILIVLTLALAGGLYAYQNILQNSLKVKSAALADENNKLDYSSINPISRIDLKMKAGKILLDGHLAISALFAALQSSTLKNLRFTDFSFSYLSSDKIALSMKGEAQSFEAVAKQADDFSNIAGISNNFQNAVFSDLSLNPTGNVDFSLITSINPSLISYRANLGGAPIVSNVVSNNVAATSTAHVSTSTKGN